MKRVLLLGFFLLLAFRGLSCNCTPIKSIKKEFLNSSAVFIGRVVSITPVQIHIDSVNTTTQYRIVFEVKQGFKNVWKKRMQIITGMDEDCGYKFIKDNEYLVFAVGGLVLETNQCTRTKELLEADVDVLVLNYLVSNPEPESEEEINKND